MKIPVDVLRSISSYLSYDDAKHYKLVLDWEKHVKNIDASEMMVKINEVARMLEVQSRIICESLPNDLDYMEKHIKRIQKKFSSDENKFESGFMSPVRISREMSMLAGWDPSELKSRVDVTKFICNYVKDRDLQNPEDRRQILPDHQLTRLLNYNRNNDGPLTYFSLQRKIQPHFLR